MNKITIGDMKKYKFSLIERRVIYEVHGSKCFYSQKLILINNFDIDHIIPESKIDKEEEIKKRLGLWEEFKINSYYNWVPSHPYENSRKGKIEYTDETILHYLNIVRPKVPKLIQLEEKYKKERDKDKVLSDLGIKLELGVIKREEIIEFMDRLVKFNFSKSQEDFEFFLKKFLLLDFKYSFGGPYPLSHTAYQAELEVYKFFKEHYETRLEPVNLGGAYDILLKNKDEIMAVELKLVKSKIRPETIDRILKGFLDNYKISKLILVIFCYNEPFKIRPNIFENLIDLSVEDFQDDDLRLNSNIKKFIIENRGMKKTVIIISKKISTVYLY